MRPIFLFPGDSRFRRVAGLVVVGLITVAPVFGAKPGKVERREMKKEAGASAEDKTPVENAQTRVMSKLREQFEITDDAEWNLISERIAHVSELRRMVSGAAGVRGPVIGDKIKPGARADVTARQEQDALRTAVRDKLPDAEIKSRLARAHEVHRQNETKLAKAQEELRALLTVRQEAVAVVAGLLPP